MSRIRNGYNSFRIKDLAGGINLENSPNEIDNKQCLSALNFNFKGNKLVNSEGYKEYEIGQSSTFGGAEIRGIEIIDGDVYAIYDDPVTGFINIMRGYDNIWRSGLVDLNTFFYKLDSVVVGQTYSIKVDGVDFIYTKTASYTAVAGDTVDVVLNNLYNQFSSEIYLKKTKGFTLINGVEVYGFFIWSFSAGSRITVNDIAGGGEIIDSARVNNGFQFNLFKSGDDLILVTKNLSPVYYQGLADESSPDNFTGFFGTEIIVGGGVDIYTGVYYNGKFICSEEGKNLLYFSKTSDELSPFLVTDFSGYDGGAQRVGGDGAITGIITGEEGLYVFKEDEIYYSNSVQDDGTGFAFVFRRITNNGAKDKYSIVRVGQDIFYYDGINKKIRRLSYEQNLTTLRDTAISTEIDLLLKNAPNSNGLQEVLYYSYPNVRFATRKEGTLGTVNNIIYTYNVDTKSWTTEEGKNVKRAFGKYFTINGDNGKMYEDNYSYMSEGEFISKEYDLGDGIDFKRFSEIEIYGVKLDNVNLFLDIYEDGIITQTFQIENNYPNNVFRNRFDLWNEGRFFKFGLRYEGVGELEINEVNIMFKNLKNNFVNYIG